VGINYGFTILCPHTALVAALRPALVVGYGRAEGQGQEDDWASGRGHAPGRDEQHSRD